MCVCVCVCLGRGGGAADVIRSSIASQHKSTQLRQTKLKTHSTYLQGARIASDEANTRHNQIACVLPFHCPFH